MADTQITGFKEIVKRFGEAPVRLINDLDKVCSRTAGRIVSRTKKGISGGYQSTFAPLSERYAKYKKRWGGSRLILVSGIRRGKRQQLGGNYRNSFASEKIKNLEHHAGSNYPQARRLEFGDDSNNTPPRPHLKPARDESEEEFHDETIETVRDFFGS